MINDIDKFSKQVTPSLTDVASATFSKAKLFHKPFMPRWNKKCEATIKAKKHAYNRLTLRATPVHIVTLGPRYPDFGLSGW